MNNESQIFKSYRTKPYKLYISLGKKIKIQENYKYNDFDWGKKKQEIKLTGDQNKQYPINTKTHIFT